jgi:tetratricopeptide (TPR) repeat protein
MSDPVRRPTPDAVQPPDRADRSETSPPLPESLAPLLRTIRRANGFTLAFVVCGTDALERQMLDQVTAQICDRHPVRHVAAGESANDLIVDIVSPETPDQPGTVVFVTGLSALVPSDVEYPPVLALLNQLRERFTRVPATVVFWVPGYVLTRLTRQSPDFWAWRSGVFTVEAPERQSERSFESPARIVDPEDFHNRTLAEKEDDYRVLSELYDERAKRPAEDPAKQVELALRLGMLTFSLGREKESREFLEAAERLSTEHDVPDLEWQLGRIAQAQRDFAAAEQWYRKSLEIKERQGNEHGAAITYHQLGVIAEEQRDFAAAEQWYRKSLEIKERQGNEHGAAYSLGQLGNLYYARREFEAASQSYQRCLEISDRLGDQSSSANAYHQLGMVAQEQRDFAAAEQWYRKSLEIDERQGNEHGAAIAYHQLGIIAEEQRDFAAAELWYRKSLEINERQGNEHGAAQTYHQLGIIAQEQSDFAAAEQWYHKSLEIKERQGNEHGAASTWFQLGRIAEEQRDVAVAEQWFQRALAVYRKLNDPHHGAMVEQALARIAELKRQAAADGDGE